MKESNIAQQKSKEKGNLDNEISKNQTDAINSKPKKMLSQFEISQLSFKNEKLSEEVKSLKAQIVNLNDSFYKSIVIGNGIYYMIKNQIQLKINIQKR